MLHNLNKMKRCCSVGLPSDHQQMHSPFRLSYRPYFIRSKWIHLGNFHLNVTHGFGISREGRKLAVMMSETTILYSLGRKIVVHDLEHNKQRAIDVGGKVKAVTSLQVCPRKRYLAISEMPNATGNPHRYRSLTWKQKSPNG